jgi:hypothetical protein
MVIRWSNSQVKLHVNTSRPYRPRILIVLGQLFEDQLALEPCSRNASPSREK